MNHDVTTRTPSGGGGAGPALIPVLRLSTVTGMVGGDSTGGVLGPGSRTGLPAVKSGSPGASVSATAGHTGFIPMRGARSCSVWSLRCFSSSRS